MNAYDRKIRNIISWSLTIGLIIGEFYLPGFISCFGYSKRGDSYNLVWAIPVAFVGIISNIDTLCHTVKFLSWICKIPSGTSNCVSSDVLGDFTSIGFLLAVLGILKGVLPPVLLTVLFIVLIIILRGLVNLQGIARQRYVRALPHLLRKKNLKSDQCYFP